MIDTLRIWTEVDHLELSLPLPDPWRQETNKKPSVVRAAWARESNGTRLVLRFMRTGERGIQVSAEGSLPRLIHGHNATQLSPDEIERAIGLLLENVSRALPELSGLGPERWQVRRMDLSEDVLVPEGQTARSLVRLIADVMEDRPTPRWKVSRERQDPRYNGLMLRHPGRSGGDSHSDGPTLKVYDKGGENRAKGSRVLRIELRLSGEAAKDELDTYDTLDKLVRYLNQKGLGRLKKDWESAFKRLHRQKFDPQTMKAIEIAVFPRRSQASRAREKRLMASEISQALRRRSTSASAVVSSRPSDGMGEEI